MKTTYIGKIFEPYLTCNASLTKIKRQSYIIRRDESGISLLWISEYLPPATKRIKLTNIGNQSRDDHLRLEWQGSNFYLKEGKAIDRI